ncbi:MAG: hypothetical protein IBJ16_07750 [Chitinophagaceae bacterium]|nr:hypothetical protein [Chitinophagaceae bacterium]
MLKKHLVLLCILISVVFIGIAAFLYPGGTISDKSTVGFIWSKNFISNLFLPQALNGAENTARIWAIIGMAFHSVGYGLFFLGMAKKIPSTHAAWVLKTVGILNILFNFLIVTPLHDSMVTISSTLSMLGLFYITVFILRSKRHFFKMACILCMLIFYFALYLYGSGDWGLLAVMQKVAFTTSMLLVLALEYFTKKEDFPPSSRITTDGCERSSG